MVSSPMYERLKAFMTAARANQNLDAWDTDHSKVLKGFDESIDQLTAYRANHGFTGATGDAMNNWVDASIKRIEWYRDNYRRGYESYTAGREVMAQALAEAETVSPDLLDAKTAAMRDDWVVEIPENSSVSGIKVPIINKKYTTGAAYVEAVEAENNAQREASAARILTQMNVGTAVMSMGMHIGAPPAPSELPEDKESGREKNPGNSSGGTPPISDQTSGGGHGYGGGGYSPENGFGREAGRNGEGYPGGFDKPWWSEADAAAARNRVIASGAVPRQELPYGELGSRTNPITDPQDLMDTDLLHTRVNGTTYRNGIVGGHTPAPPADAQHPLWRLNGGGASEAAAAGRLGGAGVLGAGALGMRGAARMGSGFGGASGSAGGMGAAGLRGITGTTGSAGAMGASNLRVGTYSGSGFGSYTPPASVAGANGAAGAGTSGVTGTTGAGGGGAAGAAGAAGRGGAGAGGGFMGGAGAGAGMGKDDKKGRKRKYVAFTVDDDEDDLPAGYVNPLSQTYGTDRTITPVKREDDGWDLRQW